MIHLGLISVEGRKFRSKFFCFTYGYPIVPAPFAEKIILSLLKCLCSFGKDLRGLFLSSQFCSVDLGQLRVCSFTNNVPCKKGLLIHSPPLTLFNTDLLSLSPPTLNVICFFNYFSNLLDSSLQKTLPLFPKCPLTL